MRLTWDNIDNFKLTKTGNFRNNSNTFILQEACKSCNNPYFMFKSCPTVNCSQSCAKSGKNNNFYGKKHSIASISKISQKAKVISVGKNNPNFKGGYWKRNIPMFNTYAERIAFAEDVRRCPEDTNVLQVKCTYCNKWYTPKRTDLAERIKVLVNGKTRGEGRLYCSNGCKKACPMFLMRKNVRGEKQASSREMQPELRKLVLERDNWICKKCSKTNIELHCHHIDPVVNNPIESADVDNCITLCKTCHIEIHKVNKNCINKC